jgi:hypothetical protein
MTSLTTLGVASRLCGNESEGLPKNELSPSSLLSSALTVLPGSSTAKHEADTAVYLSATPAPSAVVFSPGLKSELSQRVACPLPRCLIFSRSSEHLLADSTLTPAHAYTSLHLLPPHRPFAAPKTLASPRYGQEAARRRPLANSLDYSTLQRHPTAPLLPLPSLRLPLQRPSLVSSLELCRSAQAEGLSNPYAG